MSSTTLDELKVIISAQTSDFNREMRGVQSELGQLEKTYQRAADVSKIAFAAAGAAIAAGLATAVKSTATYESSLSQLKQASGATSNQMAEMAKVTRQLGQDTDLAGVTAADVARTMVELSKAGLTVKETMDATKGVMSLAKAGNIDFAQAATIAASALNAFGLQGKDANKVADMLAAGANASQAELGDLADGLQQSATVAKQFGLEMNETVTALALFANNGIKGSDAGTSLKTMLIALAKPSKEAAELMEEIGFNAYNAEGQFVGLEEMSKRLKKATEGLTEEQKQNALATIFGTDAFRAAAVLADNAGVSYDNMSASVGRAGAAQEAAAAQMGPLQKSWESFNNAISELGLAIGQRLSPSIVAATNSATQLVQSFTAGIPQMLATIESLMPVITTLVAIFVSYKAAVLAASVASAAHSAAMALVGTQYVMLNGVLMTVRTATVAQTVAQTALNTAMRLNPIGLVTAAVIGITTAFIAATSQTDSLKNATDRLNETRNRAKEATDRLKESEDRLRGAQLSVEGGTLAVERAQRTYNETLGRYGPKSLEAREAAYNLKRAEDDLKRANQEVTAATDEKKRKEQEVVNARNAVKQAEIEKADAVRRTSASLEDQKLKLGSLKGDLTSLNGRNFSYSVTGQYTLYEKKLRETGTGVPYKSPGQRYLGGPVRANRPYFVGENPDGSLNKTSELFVPRASGRIINSKDLQNMLGGDSPGRSYGYGAAANLQSNNMSHIIVNIGEEKIIDTVVRGINNKSFMKNEALLNI